MWGKLQPVPPTLRNAVGTLVTRKPVTATEEEVAANPRSRSAKLRVIEKK